MADKTITTHPIMGTSVARDWRNISGNPLRGEEITRHSGASMVEAAFASYRKPIPERLGHKGAIQARIVYPNVPEASKTGRNVRLLPPRTGLRDFWDKRKYGQVMQ